MDPLSITAAAVGITDFAISRIIELHDFINSIAEAKQEIHDAQSNLDNIHRTLIALGDLNISDNAAALEDVNKTSVAEAVNSCGDACKRFSGDLKKWTKHSSVDHMPLRDRFVVNVWNKEKVRTFRTNLQGCQTTVQFAVTSCQLRMQIRAEKTWGTNQQSTTNQLQALENEVHQQLDILKKLQEETQKRNQELQKEPEDEDDDDASHRNSAIGEVAKQLKVLEAEQVSCGVVFAQAQSARTGLEIGNVLTQDHSFALVGLTSNVVGKINARIGNVTTNKSSVSVVGRYDGNIDMSNLGRKKSSKQHQIDSTESESSQ